MEELYINILRSPARSLFRRILGVLYIVIGVAWLILRLSTDEPVSNRLTVTFLDLIFTVFFGFAGAVNLIEGNGISLSSWLGESYIKIDMTRLCIKKGVFSKEWVLVWSDIEQVEFSVIKIKFRLINNSYVELNYDNLEYEQIQEIKKSIKAIAGEKNIKVIIPVQP
jgi:hypothetical protein